MHLALMLGTACAAPSEPNRCTLAGLSHSIRQTHSAFSQMDASGFATAVRKVQRSLHCQTERLPPHLCAQVHVVFALDAFYEENWTFAKACFWSAKMADPTVELNFELAPRGHVLHGVFSSAESEARPNEPSIRRPLPVEGWIVVDGDRRNEFPQDRPFVLQHMTAQGTVLDSRYVDRLSELPVGSLGTTRRKRRTSLLATGLGLEILAAAAIGTSVVTRSQFDAADSAGRSSDAQRFGLWTNGLVIGSAGAASLGLGLTTAGLLVK